MTADAILGMDFLSDNKCTQETANKMIYFQDRGVSINLPDSSSESCNVQALVTLE